MYYNFNLADLCRNIGYPALTSVVFGSTAIN